MSITFKIRDKPVWTVSQPVIMLPRLQRLWALQIGFGASVFFKYDLIIILLMRGTAASSVQNKDRSAGWSVARGATLLSWWGIRCILTTSKTLTQKDDSKTESCVILAAHIWHAQALQSFSPPPIMPCGINELYGFHIQSQCPDCLALWGGKKVWFWKRAKEMINVESHCKWRDEELEEMEQANWM